MKKNKITVIMGEAKLTRPASSSVTAEGRQEDAFRASTSSSPPARARANCRSLAKADGKRIWTYRHAMTPPEMPSKLLVIGSGAIGIEFASFYNDWADVTVVEMMDRIVPVEDADVSAFLEKALEKQGMKILTGPASTGI
jgi:dihydrolipoamide dehydrogenase